MKKQDDKPYMDKPKKVDNQIKDQLLYGDGDITVEGIEKKKKDYQDKMLNE